MIVVDSSVWIANLRKQPVPAVRKLREPDVADASIVGDIVLTEVLQGERDEARAAYAQGNAGLFAVTSWLEDALQG